MLKKFCYLAMKWKNILAQTPDDIVERITAFIPAEPVSRVNPKYPKEAAKSGAEGWVQMSYVVDTQGNVQDPIVEDSGGHRIFRRAAMSAIKGWKYSPAIKDGKPTEMCHQSVQFNFTMRGKTGAKKRFIHQYKAAKTLIAEGDYEAAETRIQKRHNNRNLNRYENTWLWNIDATLANKLDEPKRQVASMKRTLASSNSHEDQHKTFDDEYIGSLRQRLFILQLNLGRYASALDTLEDLKAMPKGETLVAPLSKMVTYINDYLASDKNLSINIELNSSNGYLHKLARNHFAFVNIQGKVDSVEIRCESHRERFTVAEDFIWSIPEGWGKCHVWIKGAEDTSFDLIEVGKV